MNTITTVYLPVGVGTYHMETAADQFARSIRMLREIDKDVIVPEAPLLSVDAVRDFLAPIKPDLVIFQNLTYYVETPCCNQNVLPVLLIMTSNAPDYGYRALLQNYQRTMERFVGPTEVFVSGDTLQLKDYSKTDWEWSIFDPEAKKRRHETVFPLECKKAFDMGIQLTKSGKEV